MNMRLMGWILATGGAAGAMLGVACSSGGASSSAEATSYCQTVFSTLQSCNLFPASQECTSELTQLCGQAISSVYSADGLAAIGGCPFPTDCSCYTDTKNGPCAQSLAYEQCLASKVSTLPTTPALQSVAADFCKTCPDGASKSDPQSCSNFLSNGAGGLGSSLKVLSDSTLQTIGASCTGAHLADAGTSDCAQAFLECASKLEGTTLTTALPVTADAAPPACQSAFAKDGG